MLHANPLLPIAWPYGNRRTETMNATRSIPAPTSNMGRIPAATADASLVTICGAPAANTLPKTAVPVMNPKPRDRLSIPDVTPRAVP